MRRLAIAYAGSAVEVESRGAAAMEAVRFVLGGQAVTSPPVAPHAFYRLVPADGGRHALYRDTVLLAEGADLAALAEQLMGAVSFDLADRSSGGLLLHAAAVLDGQTALVLPGGIGAGKSTLTLWLATRGFPYLSDEMVYVPDGTATAVPLRRPLNLKQEAIPVARGFFDPGRGASRILAVPGGEMIDPDLLAAPLSGSSGVPIGRIVFPAYDPASAGELTPLSGARTGFSLMRCLVNARNLPDHGFPQVSRLAASVPACTLRYARFDQVEARLLRWLAGD